MKRLVPLVIIGVALLALACGSATDTASTTESTTTAVVESTATTQAPTTTTTTTERPTTTTTTELFTAENWATLMLDLESHIGAQVDIVGKVFQIEKAADGVWMQVWADPVNAEWNTIIGFADPGFVVTEDDYVHAVGTITEIFKGTNAFGAELELPRVVADTLEVVDATVIGPEAVRTFDTELKQNQHGIEVVVTKVEFAATETRVFVIVRNGTSKNATFYDFNAKATQGSKQFEPDSFGSDYPEVQSDLLPGIESEGVIVFGPMDPAKATKLYLEARSENYSLDFEPYVYSIPAA